ncbi:hypothetical protein C2845_PM01G08670 [Panicum miliaceum]|uniref:Protein kinase domain-containing protein n=1 Tax=Panicum miliaceum TaxID=4540 RepID=A0A3L6TJP3_PANMI|nr:hypothetical protein C2845_PM01G08670 [Panicum miliaceum]
MAGMGGEGRVDLLVEIIIRDGAAAGPYRLIPRWESCAPQPAGGRALVASSGATASLPAREDPGLPFTSFPPEVEKLLLHIVKGGESIRSIPLVRCSSQQRSGDLKSTDGNLYVNLEIYPEEAGTNLRLYELEVEGSEITWKSTGFYFMGSISIGLGSEKDSSMVDGMCNSPEQLFGKEPAYFHGKYCDEIPFVPLKINFEEDFAHDKELETELKSNNHIFRQILKGIAFMHQRGILHKDIKPENILVEQDLTIKIADFGTAKVPVGANRSGFAGGVYGTRPYAAPELVNTCNCIDDKVDIFSAGMIYCELFFRFRKQAKGRLGDFDSKIRFYARKLEFDLVQQKFDLDEALQGTNILENWTGNMVILKSMLIHWRSVMHIIYLFIGYSLYELFDLEAPDNEDESIEDDVNERINSAFCPQRVTAYDPCFEYIKSVAFPWFGNLEVVQKEGNGGNKIFSSMEELIVGYESGYLDSTDVKLALQKAINDILEFQDEITADMQKILMQNKDLVNL